MEKKNKATLHTYVDEAIDRAISENRIVGTVVQIALGGELIYSRAAVSQTGSKSVPWQKTLCFDWLP